MCYRIAFNLLSQSEGDFNLHILKISYKSINDLHDSEFFPNEEKNPRKTKET
jgi:hypothetical protein